ncbi:GIY-YIG nuclease family protein [Laceyella putida]|uniref:GIY-YIG nuclease family protein n=1 Tax=Laceyella putida TaxID=110101 RepID=A0ABW2RF06_9BACL
MITAMMGIYAIRNKANRKVYVGQSIHIQNRFKQHLAALEKGNHHSKKLQEDFDKFGPEQFTLEILEICKRDELDQKEIEWINKFDSLQNGYNVQGPQNQKSQWFQREKRPVVTAWGELTRTIRDFSLISVEDFKYWLIENKKGVQQALILFMLFIGLVTLIVSLILINDLFELIIPNYSKSLISGVYFLSSLATIAFYVVLVGTLGSKNNWWD